MKITGGVEMKRILWFVAAAALMFAASGASAQEKCEKSDKLCGRMAMHGGPRMPGLTEDQQKKAQALDLETEKAVLPLKAQLDVKTAELKALAVAENPDKGAIDKKIEEIGALRTQIMKKKILNKLAVRALLTPDQRVEFDRKALRGGRELMECGEEGPGPGSEKFMMMNGMRHGGGRMMRHQAPDKNVEVEVRTHVEKETEKEK
jgi:Spy/CpxP family protein refolding chaperone